MSIMYRTTNVNTNACSKNPNIVGHPLLDAIGPSNPPNSEFTALYVHGLKSNSKTNVVYRVYLHLAEELGSAIIYSKYLFFSPYQYNDSNKIPPSVFTKNSNIER